jgi:hypothetical protein
VPAFQGLLRPWDMLGKSGFRDPKKSIKKSRTIHRIEIFETNIKCQMNFTKRLTDTKIYLSG